MNRQFFEISGKRIYVNENHHESILSWATERKRVEKPLFVITLDHHTDTLPAFTHASEVMRKPFFLNADYRKEEDLMQALQSLRHDEHFDYALKTDVISGAVLITHENYSIEHDSRLLIVHQPPEDKSLSGLSDYYGQALESDFLRKNLIAADCCPPTIPYLLDIDLDYFKTRRSVFPEDLSMFNTLVKNAVAITICLESDWVRLLNMDFDRFLNSSFFLERLLDLIRNAMTSK